jgi:hypothetical protein
MARTIVDAMNRLFPAWFGREPLGCVAGDP